MLATKVVVALNMADILEERGIQIDTKKLEQALGVRVVKISALKGTGMKELVSAIESKESFIKPKVFDEKIENAVQKITTAISRRPQKVCGG